MQSEPLIRLTIFLATLAVLLIAQRLWPARGDGRWSMRQLTNAALVAIDTLVLRLAFPVLAVTFAVQVHGGGLYGWLDWPAWLEIVTAILLLDVAIYWQHRLLHTIPVLWRMHRVHHADTGFDVTTGVRFHPLEIVLSMGIKLALVWLLAPHPLAVLIFEILLSAGSLFTHSDFRFPPALDRRLRWLIVTPSMHRIHHSTWRPETDSNYGFHLSTWDRIFDSYTPAPREDERRMLIGLERFRSPREQSLISLLINPFRRDTAADRKPENDDA
ncbi:sterol desaturase family protein [Wenzhouxiangella sp. XN201]|uniref:sterol desaturase family protein n=1 Tax=Wenzhouxiangella sp. XN201 TaxID=2710755 RepID=UPI003204BD3C